MAKANKAARAQAKAEVKAHSDAQVVKMKFKEDKFYNDPTTPHFEAGKVYTVKGLDVINRWLKRGGEIVSGELSLPEKEDNSSVVVSNEHSESSPLGSKKTEPKEVDESGDEVDSDDDASDSVSNQQDEE